MALIPIIKFERALPPSPTAPRDEAPAEMVRAAEPCAAASRSSCPFTASDTPACKKGESALQSPAAWQKWASWSWGRWGSAKKFHPESLESRKSHTKTTTKCEEIMRPMAQL